VNCGSGYRRVDTFWPGQRESAGRVRRRIHLKSQIRARLVVENDVTYMVSLLRRCMVDLSY
jgi:hypothetical protein